VESCKAYLMLLSSPLLQITLLLHCRRRHHHCIQQQIQRLSTFQQSGGLLRQ